MIPPPPPRPESELASLPATILGQRGTWQPWVSPEECGADLVFTGQPERHAYRIEAYRFPHRAAHEAWTVIVVSRRTRVAVSGHGDDVQHAALDAVARLDDLVSLAPELRAQSRRAA